MKAKYLLTALAVPALFAACADDEFSANVNKGEMADGQLIELNKDFAIGLNQGGTAETRTSWHYNGTGAVLFSWLPTFNAGGSAATSENIGFAWRGETADAKVRTNYKFTLDGFLKKGEAAPKTKICDGKVLVLNGYTLTRGTDGELTVSGNKIALKEYDATSQSMVASSYSVEYVANNNAKIDGATTGTYPNFLTESNLASNDPYVRNGIFTTDNSTIFKGDYIVYFPYDPTFAEVGYLPATAETQFVQDDANANRVAHLAGKTFGYGTATISKGGSMAESFSTKNLSSIVDFKIKAQSGTKNIQKIILVDEAAGAKGFIKKVGLDASKIAAGQTGTNLYVGDAEYEPTVVLSLVNGSTEYAAVSTTYKEFTIAVLPTTLTKPVIYLMDDNGLCCRKELDATKTLVAGGGTQYTVTIADTDLFNQKLAVDTKTLIEQISAAGAAAVDGTVTVLGNITLDKNAMIKLNGQTYTGTLVPASNNSALTSSGTDGLFGLKTTRSLYVAKNVTVNGTGVITIPADVALTLKAVNGMTLTINNPVVIESEGCCGSKPGKVIILTKQGSYGTVKFNGKVTNYGRMWLANNASNSGTYTPLLNATTVQFSDLVNGEDEFENKGEINCFGYYNSTIKVTGKLTNEGKINIQAKAINMDGTLGEEISTQTQAVKVNVNAVENNGTILVGKYTKLSVAGAATNNGEVSIETAATVNNSEDGELYIADAGEITNNNLIENFGVLNNEGALKNNAEDAVIIDHVGCQFGGNKAQATPGEYICEVEDNDVAVEGDRLAYAMGENMPTTTIKFVGNGATTGESGKYIYNLDGYKAGNVLDYNFIIATGASSKVELKANKAVTSYGVTTYVPQAVTINGKLIVEDELELTNIMLTVKEAVEVAAGAEMKVNPVSSTASTTENNVALTADKDVNVNANSSVGGTFVVAKFARTDLKQNLNIAKRAAATFNYATYTNVANNIAINGTFTRVVSSGSATANPAQVWCGSYTKGTSASIPNGLPQKR